MNTGRGFKSHKRQNNLFCKFVLIKNFKKLLIVFLTILIYYFKLKKNFNYKTFEILNSN